MRKRSLAIRFLGWTAAVLILMLLTSIAVVNTPPAQRWLTGRLTDFLRQRTGVEAGIDRIRLRLPRGLLIEGVFLPDQEGDTLLYAGRLRMGFRLGPLLDRRIHIRYLELADIRLDLHPHVDSVMNYAFLLDAFGSKTPPEPAQADTARSSWHIDAPEAVLRLRRIDVHYADSSGYLDLAAHLGRFDARAPAFDLATMAIDLHTVLLADTRVALRLRGESPAAPAAAGRATTPLSVRAGELRLENAGFDLDTDALRLRSHLRKSRLDSAAFSMDATDTRINGAAFDLRGGRLRYEQAGAPRQPGFDYRRLDLDSIRLHLRDLSYHNQAITLSVEQAAAADRSGLALNALRADIRYWPDSVRLRDLALRTRRSRIDLPMAAFAFPSPEPAGQRLRVRMRSSVLSPEDLALFVPALYDNAVFQKHRGQGITVSGDLAGTLAGLDVRRLAVSAWGARLAATGRVRHLTDVGRLEAELQLPDLAVSRTGLEGWLPPLPPHVELPETLEGAGQVSGPLGNLTLALRLQATRPGAPAAAVLAARARLEGLPDARQLRHHVYIDTLLSTREDLLAYLPAGPLPIFREPPRQVLLAGELSGSLDELRVDLRLAAGEPAEQGGMHLSGSLSGIRQIDSLRADLRADSLFLASPLLAGFLPDSTLPPYLRLPGIGPGRAELAGGREQGRLNLDLPTGAGDVALSGNWRDSSFQGRFVLRRLDARQLLDSAAYDTLVGRPLSPLTLRLEAGGHGFDPNTNLVADIALSLLPEAAHLGWRDGLRLRGRVDRKSFRGELRVDEPGLRGEARTAFDFNIDSAATTDLSLQLGALDLLRLRLSSVPLETSGRLTLHAEGASPRRFRGDLDIRSVDLRYDSSRQQLDSLLLSVRLAPDSNDISLRSDIARGFLRGRFTYPVITADLSDLLRAYFDPTARPDTSRRRDSLAHFDLALDIVRPAFFTSGIIPGLGELAPVAVRGAYSAERQALSLRADLPRLDYRGIRTDSLLFRLAVGADTLDYRLSFREMEAFDQLRAVNVALRGQAAGGAVLNELTQVDERGRRRFDVRLSAERDGDQVSFRFAPEALLNYDTWRFSTGNHIRLGREYLRVDDWRLSRDRQSLSLTDRRNSTLIAALDGFDLTVLANTVRYDSRLVRGLAGGRITGSDIFTRPRLAVDLTVRDFAVLDAELGDLDAELIQEDSAGWRGQFDFRGAGHDVAARGAYRPRRTGAGLDLRLDIRALDLARLQPLAAGSLDSLSGIATGRIALTGDIAAPALSGELRFPSAAVVPSALKTRWRLDDQVLRISHRSNRSTVHFDQFTVRDAAGGAFTISGDIATPDLRTYRLGLNLTARQFLVLDTKKKDNDQYYGRLPVDVSGYLGGALDSASLSLNVTPGKNASLTYVYAVDQLEAVGTGQGIIEFRDPASRRPGESRKSAAPARDGLNPLGWDFLINAAVNDNLELRIITNPVSGDYFSGRGQGNLTYRLSPRGEMDLAGQVSLKEGTYLFSYTELIKREFRVLDGSRVSWTGDPADPELSVRAQYSTRAVPLPLVTAFGGGTSGASQLQRRQDFQVIFSLNGSLDNLRVDTDIAYPRTPLNTGNDDIETAIAQLNQDESETNRQAFSLLLFNGFLTAAPGAGTGMRAINLQQGLSSVLTNYLNTIAAQYVNFVEIELDIESSGDQASYLERTDFRLRVRKRLLNNRLEIRLDGVASGRNGDPGRDEMQAYLDNITIEYALSQDGQLRLRLYNERDVQDILGGEVIKLGGALAFSRDFQRLRLFPRRQKPAAAPDNPQNDPR